MATHTTASRSDKELHLFAEQLDALKSNVKKLVGRATMKPTWFGRAVDRTGETIKAHPIVAISGAVGFGYVIFRIARR